MTNLDTTDINDSTVFTLVVWTANNDNRIEYYREYSLHAPGTDSNSVYAWDTTKPFTPATPPAFETRNHESLADALVAIKNKIDRNDEVQTKI